MKHSDVFVAVVIRHASQVRELRIAYYQPGAESLLSKLSSGKHIPSPFSALSTLILSQPSFDDGCHDLSSLSALRHVTLCNALPRFSKQNQIISCELEFDGPYTEIRPIADFLNTLREMKELSIKVRSDGFSHSAKDVKVHLRKLETFRIMAQPMGEGDFFNDLRHIMSEQSFPRVTTLSINRLLGENEIMDEDLLPGWFLKYFPATETLLLNAQECLNTVVSWSKILRSLPNLKNLNIQGAKILNTFDVEYPYDKYETPKLRSVTVRDCCNIRDSFFSNIATLVGDDKRTWGELEMITVENCRYVSKSEVEKILPAGLLDWR